MNPILPIELLLPLLLVFAAGALHFAWRATSSLLPRLRVPLLALRGAAVCGLALIALNPGAWKSPVERTDTDWAVLLDRSASMASRDVEGRSRWEAALGLAARASGRADDPGRVRFFTFSGKLDEEAAALDAVGKQAEPRGDLTEIPGALNELFTRYQSRQRGLSGALLLSDGRQRGLQNPDEAARLARSLAAPVYAVALGGAMATADLSIEPLRPGVVGFAGRPLPLGARLKNTGLGPLRPRVRVLDAGGREVASCVVTCAANATAEFALSVTSPAGYSEFTLAVDPPEGDRIAANNRSAVGVQALGEPLRVLVAEGVPHWDSKFLVQLLRKQPQFRLTTVHRLASERFFRIGDGADAQTREAFPDTLEELAGYDIVIFGRGAEYFLTAERTKNLRRFVRELGGAVLFARSKPYDGNLPELAEMEPLAWGAALPSDAAAVTWRPTAEGEAAGLFGASLPGAKSGLWPRLPGVAPQQQVRSLPAFATALVASESPDGVRTPLVASRRYGKGQTATVNIKGLWRWDFFPTAEEAGRIYKIFWPELVQWLGTHGDFLPGRGVSVRVASSQAAPDEPVQAVVQLRGGAPGEKASPVVRIFADGRPVQEIRPQRLAGEDAWPLVFAPATSGLYRVEASLENNPSAGTALALLRVKPPPSESDDASADPAYLARLAEATGGRLLAATNLETAVRAFDAKAPDATDAPPVWIPGWDRGWLLAALLGAMAGEWFLRRRHGLL